MLAVVPENGLPRFNNAMASRYTY